MDNLDSNKLMGLAEAYVGLMIDAIYRRLMDRDFALEDPELVMLLVATFIFVFDINNFACHFVDRNL